MNKKFLMIGILIVVQLAWGAGVPASVSGADSAPGTDRNGNLDIDQAVPGWQQVNVSGFGDPQVGEVSALEAFNGYIYAGTFNPINPLPGQLYDGAQIFRSSDGLTWNAVTEPGFGNTHDIAPPAILDFIAFNNKLYASTGRGNASQIWRTQNGLIWAPMDVTGFGDPDNVDLTALAVYNGQIYAGVTNQTTGAQIWRSYTGDNNTWTQVAPAVPGTVASTITGFARFGFDGGLYAAVESEAPAQIWRSYGSDWTTVVSNGFGDSETIFTGGMVEFGSYLYVGAGNAVSGAQLWRTNDGMTWEQTITPGFGDSTNTKVEMVIVFQNQLYVSVKNTATGIELWRSANGVQWERANQDGFGDSNNAGTNNSNATANFVGQLYVGTSNSVDGGELWRMQQPYGVDLSPSDSLSGPAGQTITYTLWISNTGEMADSFDLTATGQTWTTTLSKSLVNLAPSASAAFTVAVVIPPGAADLETDTVTIKATSQGDNTKTDSAVLTTTSITNPLYGVALSGDESLSGPAGGQVFYTVAITNTGNVVDTYNLMITGNTWTTTLSSPTVSLAAGKSQAVMVTVSIPPGAADQETDTVTITAISQGDSSKNETALLTTISERQLAQIFMPLVLTSFTLLSPGY